MEMSNVKLDMAGRPLPDRTYPAETGSEGYQLHESSNTGLRRRQIRNISYIAIVICASLGANSTSVWTISPRV